MSAGLADPPFLAEQEIRLKAGVRRIRRNDALLLLSPSGDAVMVTPLLDEIWHALVAGTQLQDLAETLAARHPRARDIPVKLLMFIDRLWSAGLLEGSGKRTAQRERRITFDSDSLAGAVARPLRVIPRALGIPLVAVIAIAASAGLLWLLVAVPDHPRLRHLFDHLSPWGISTILLVLVPLHELGHAVACRLIGVSPGGMGIRFPRFGMPRPFVETNAVWNVEGRRRFWVAAGGPLADLIAGGVAAWTLIAWDRPGIVQSVAWLVALYACVAINVGTSPLPTGDGSHMLEALLDDDFARSGALLGRTNRFVRPRSVLRYRIACGMHLALTVLLFLCLR